MIKACSRRWGKYGCESFSQQVFLSLAPISFIDMNLDVIFSMSRPNGAGGGGSKSGADSIMWANIQALCITKKWRMACRTSAGTIKRDRFLNLSINPRWACPVPPETARLRYPWKFLAVSRARSFHLMDPWGSEMPFALYQDTDSTRKDTTAQARIKVSGSFSANKAARDYNFQTWKSPKVAGSSYLKPKPHNLYLFKSPGHLWAHISLGKNCWVFPISENHLKRILKVFGILGLGRLWRISGRSEFRTKQAFKWVSFHQQKYKPNFLFFLFPNIKCVNEKKKNPEELFKTAMQSMSQRYVPRLRAFGNDWSSNAYSVLVAVKDRIMTRPLCSLTQQGDSGSVFI